MQAGQSSKSLTIAAPRDFAAKWLAPRLAEYARNDPDLRFVLLTSDGEIDFTQANIDLAIHWGADPGEHEGVKLADGAMVSVVGSDDSAAATVIAWPGAPAEEAVTLSVADAGLAIDAAAHGFGKATVPVLLAQADIAAGRVRAIGESSPVADAYWLIAPLPQWRQKKVKMLVAALTAQNGTFLVG